MQAINTFVPLPWQIAPFNDFSDTLLLTGSAGGGKSRLGYEKVHAYCLRYPGVTSVLFRKEETDAMKSAVVGMQSQVIGDDPRVTMIKKDRMFRYTNGSVIYWTGLKDERARESLRSIGKDGGIGMALLEEAIEFEEEDYDEVSFRMRDTNAPFRQIILATNPGPELHWINRRLILGGEATVYYSSVALNPHAPQDYVKRIAKARGITGKRLREGKWTSGEFLVFDGWNDHLNVTTEADYVPRGGRVQLWADDGYSGEMDKNGMFTPKSNPRVFLLVQITRSGTYKVFAEMYRVKNLYEKNIADFVAMCKDNKWPIPGLAIHDSASPTLGKYLKNACGRAEYVTPKIADSIRQTNDIISADENGVRRLIVHPRCKNLRLELGAYVTKPDGTPIEYWNHGPDTLRYGIAFNEDAPADADVDAQGIEEHEIDEIEAKVEMVMAQLGLIEE